MDFSEHKPYLQTICLEINRKRKLQNKHYVYIRYESQVIGDHMWKTHVVSFSLSLLLFCLDMVNQLFWVKKYLRMVSETDYPWVAYSFG